MNQTLLYFTLGRNKGFRFNQERIKLYFVIYDYKDNIIAYLDNIFELSMFVNRPVRKLKYRFKTQNCVYVEDKHILKIYKFN